MSRQFVTMGMGMGGVFGGECRFFNCFMRRMGKGMFSGMMPGVFEMTGPVFTWSCFLRGICAGICFW